MRRSFIGVWLVVIFLSAFLFSNNPSAHAADTLSLTIPADAAEGDGVLPGAGSISISEPLVSDLLVNIVSDDTSEITVPATVTIPAGETSAIFDLNVVDDLKVDGVETATITASAPGWISVNGSMAVFDNDFVDLTRSITAGWIHSFALKEDGTVWAWGGNPYGQLGDGTSENKILPVPVSNLTDIIEVAGGGGTSMALRADGTVWAWGAGSLGDDTTIDSTTPVKVLNLDGVVAISRGFEHGLALKEDGTVWAWGRNLYGQLGNGTNEDKTLPVQVSILTDIVEIACGGCHNLAFKADGTVWAWGLNDYGQLGDGTNDPRLMPVQVTNLTDTIAIAAGAYHSLALKADGTVWSWGRNGSGQLGDGSQEVRFTPVQVLDLNDVIALGGGGYAHSLALKSDGTIWAWGRNYWGTLGDGTTTEQLTPVQVLNLVDVVKIASGDEHSLAIKSDGTAWSWGYNGSGRLGNGTKANSKIPVQVKGPQGVGFLHLRSVSVSVPNSAWEDDGILHDRGMVSVSDPPSSDLVVNLSSDDPTGVQVPASVTIPAGQLFARFDLTPVDDALLDGSQVVTISAAAAGFDTGSDTILVHDNETATLSVALPAIAKEGDGVLSGQALVTVSTSVDTDAIVYLSSDDLTEVTVPEEIIIPANQTSATFDLTIVDDDEFDGVQSATVSAYVTGWASGSDIIDVEDNETKDLSLWVPPTSAGRTGVLVGAGAVTIPGTLTADLTVDLTSSNPTVLTVPAAVTIAAGQFQARFDLTIVGNAGAGEPQNVTISAFSAGWPPANDTIVIPADGQTGILNILDGGGGHSLALETTGSIWAWGRNLYGELGNGNETTTHSLKPVQVLNLADTIAVTAGYEHNVALQSDGTVWAWGSGKYGTLGNGAEDNHFSPIKVADLDNVVTISAGDSHSLALKSDGTAWAWGRNIFGQLGDGTNTSRLTPVQVSNLTDTVSVVAGSAHSLGLKSDGTVWAWGRNNNGQLGDGTTTNSLIPIQLSNLTDIIAVAAGGYHSLALKSDGTVWAWGRNYFGQLGDGTLTDRNVPIQVSSLTDAIAVAAGYNYSLALKSEGTILAWGCNDKGQLGDSTDIDHSVPVLVSNISQIIAIAVGDEHTLAVKSDGTVWSWGDNSNGKLGDNSSTSRFSPVKVVGPEGVGYLNLNVRPPDTPDNPDPADGAVEVPLTDGSVVLSWHGGQPEPYNTLTYNVLFGTTPANLILVAENIIETNYQIDGLEPTLLYRWQIVAKNSAGMQTSGPVWQFTTWKPDLVVSQVTWTPTDNIFAGQEITFSAVIKNNGAALKDNPFQVEFKIDGNTIGVQTVNQPLSGGETVEITQTWLAFFGDHTLEVISDRGSWIDESDEENNTRSASLPTIIDPTPPELVSNTPVDGDIRQQVDQIVVVLSDPFGIIDDEAVIAGFKVFDSKNSAVIGVVSEENDAFTFKPNNKPLPDDSYQVSVDAKDMAGNTETFSFQFEVDGTPPPVPVIDPVVSPTYEPQQVLSGTKEAYAAISINDKQVIGNIPETSWQHTLNLKSGPNTYAVKAIDRAGNQSEEATVEIIYDDFPPPPVDTLTLDTQGDGISIQLDWTGYDESAQGDLAVYRIYVETANYSDVSNLTPKAVVPAGNFGYTAKNLTRGTTYWFAVIAVDVEGNAHNTVTPLSGVPVDVMPPDDVTNLEVQCFADRLVFTWNPSADTHGDLAGYHVYFGNEPEPIPLAADTNSYERSGLAPASGHLFRIFAVDNDDNASIGKAVTGVTWLPNPANLVAAPQSGYVDLFWDAVSPAEYVKHYAIYISQADFSSVAGMSPVLTVPRTADPPTKAKVAGLTNKTTYYFAVTTVNTANAQDPVVSTVSATPTPDTEGPEISAVTVNGEALVSGHTLNTSATFACQATDPAGISRVEFAIDGVVIETDTNPEYSAYWDIVSASDGNHTLTITAYDSLANISSLDYDLIVALEPPAAPTITQPTNGTVTNEQTIVVSGQAEKSSEVMVYKNSTEAVSWLTVDAQGGFRTSLTLSEGENHLTAAARNRAGTGPSSAEVLVTLDTTLPQSPIGLQATAVAAGAVNLSWQPPSESVVVGYDVYRHDSSFSAPGAVVKVNTHLIDGTVFNDLPPADGTWYYRVAAVDEAANQSDLSNEASAVSDNTMPRASSIEYFPQGPYDPASGRMAPGTVNVVLTVSEPLQTKPYLSIAPEGAVPIAVELKKDTDPTYTGFFVITDTTPSGTAYAIFSGRDVVGNRGTEIDDGASIRIDTDGPVITHLAIDPTSPIKNDEQNPVTITAAIGLSEKIKSGEVPQLSCLLSAEGRQAIIIDQISQVDTQPGDIQSWQAVFTLSADAGLSAPETFKFIYQGVDDLNNVGDRLLTPNLFQVYQGDLPPLEPPENFKGQALPGGNIRLTWDAVEDAAGYQLYRQAPTETELSAYERLDGIEEFIDEPVEEGTYTYAIASIRVENEEEALSAPSDPVVVESDSTAPGAPQNLALELVATGIKAQWQPPANTEEMTYALYRSPDEITSVEGLTPLATGIDQTQAVDPTPSPNDHYYVVTAVDAVGNESPTSNCPYLNFELLPVATISVRQVDNDPPVVSWTHPGGSIAGYDIYLGAGAQMVKLNEALLTDTSYTDIGYAGDERRYTVIAVDVNDVQSLGRSITLPLLEATPSAESRIKRGVMNRLQYTVENSGHNGFDNLRLVVGVDNYEHGSEQFSLNAGESLPVSVVVGGYDDLADVSVLTTTIEMTPHEGERAEIVRTAEIEVAEGMLVLQILNEEFTRGGNGSLRFTLENTGDEAIEIVTATVAGAAPSDEIKAYLLDADGNVLSTAAFKQSINVNILENGRCVAVILGGATFTSEAMPIPVPITAPEQVILELVISQIHHHLGQPGQVSMDGPQITHEISLVDTAYYGEITDITPQTSSGDQDVIISGQAVDRDTRQPLAEVALDVVVHANGFERIAQKFTDVDGSFAYHFTPIPGDSGTYDVCVIHPDVNDRPQQAQFVITRVAVSPSIIDLNVPRNYEQTISVYATAGNGTVINNLRLAYDALDQVEGEFPEGVHVTLGPAVDVLAPGQSAALRCTVWADNSAAQTGKLIFKVKSDETADGAWETVVVNTLFSEAEPALYFTPNYLETGLARDETVIENIILENRGLATLNDVEIALFDQSGAEAPEWVYLNSETSQGDLEVGEKREISIGFAPTEDVAEGVHAFYLQVTSANHATVDINLYAAVTQSGVGDALFKVIDIYTGTLDQNAEVIQGLAGAQITVQNEKVLSEKFTKVTDAAGEAYFVDLPAGHYKFRATSANHQDHIGRLWVKPGITTTTDVTLQNNLVTVEWEVVETTIEDEYEIVLKVTYETNVPAPVIVAEPASTVLPKMQAGDVLYGEFTLTNYGLIRGDFFNIQLPEDDENYSYELLAGLPAALEAKQQISVPFRVTCLQSPDEPEGQSSGGGSSSGGASFSFPYRGSCYSGHTIHHIIQRRSGSGGGARRIYRPNYPSSSGTSGTPRSSGISGTRCIPSHARRETYRKDTRWDISQEVGCSVNTLLREFNDDAVDLSVKVPGGAIHVQRLFYGNQWHWSHSRHNLTFNIDVLGRVESIDKGGVLYEPDSSVITVDSGNMNLSGNFVYKHESYAITRSNITGGGFRWSDKHGSWKEFDLKGRMIAYGNRRGIIGKLIYEAGEDGRLSSIADRNDNPVIWYEYYADGRLAAVYDADNRRVDYTYTDGRLTGVNDVKEYDSFYEYDGKGRIKRTVDAGGRPTIVAYDDYGDVKSVVNRLGKGHYFEYGYDQAKKEQYSRITTSSGRIKEIWFDRDNEIKRIDINGRTIKNIKRDGRVNIITDEKGKVTYKEYDEWENLVKITRADDSTISFEYEHTFNKPTRIVDPRGVVSKLEYDDNGNLLTKTDAFGTDAERITQYTYDADNHLLTATVEADADTEAATTTLTYYDDGNIESITDPEGNVTQFLEYDISGNLLKMEDPRGHQWTFKYDDLGRLESQTDPLGHITAYEYDGANNRTAVINTYLKRFEFEYDDHNNLVKAIDPYEKFSRIEYNSDNLPTKAVDPEGKVSETDYDNEGRILRSIDGAGNEIVYHYDETAATTVSSYKPVRIDYPTFSRRLYYDELERVVKQTDILDETTRYSRKWAYDAAGNVESITDENDKTTTFEYDALNRLIETTDALGAETKRKYDDRGNLIEIQDPNQGITFYEYDRNNRLLKAIRPMTELTTYEYDAVGNRTAVFDAKGQKIAYEYNAINRLERVRYYAADDHNNPVKTVDFTYDDLGNIKTYNDGTTSATYDYDDLQRKTHESIDYGLFTKSYAYTYYDNGLKKTFTGPDGTTINYTYDENNRISGIAIPGQGQITYNTYQWNSPTRITLPGGSTTDYTYDPLMQVKSIVARDPGQNPLMTRAYSYSAVGSITEKVAEHGSYIYEYDDLQRLTEAVNPLSDDETYTYDLLGNRLTAANVPGSWSYNANNELTGYDNVSFAYDDNGNMTRKSVGVQETNYIYDVEDRLVLVENEIGSVIATYYYDPFGRRLWKEVDSVRTYYLYSEEGLIGEYDQNGAEIKTYGYAPDSTWTTDPLFVKIAGTYYWYQNDHAGTPHKIIDTSGKVVWSAAYDSFGNIQIQTAEIVNNLRFAGQYFDAETGLYYNLNRYYDPTTGRYLRTDPFGEGLNLYPYVFNNPVNLIDPEGLCAINNVWQLSDSDPLKLFSTFYFPGVSDLDDLKQLWDAITWKSKSDPMHELRNELEKRIKYLTKKMRSHDRNVAERIKKQINIYYEEVSTLNDLAQQSNNRRINSEIDERLLNLYDKMEKLRPFEKQISTEERNIYSQELERQFQLWVIVMGEIGEEALEFVH